MYIADYNLWFRPEVTRLEKLQTLIEILENKFNGYETLIKSKCDGYNSQKLIESYLTDNNHIKTTETRLARYGELYYLSIDHNVGLHNLIRVVKEFVYEISYGCIDLPYVAMYTKKKNSFFVTIWIADREWGVFEQRYDRDYYFDKETGKPSNKDNPNAIHKCVKGEPKFDSHGNVIIRNWASRKIRIFHEDYRDSNPRYYDTLEAIFIRIKNNELNRLRLKRLAMRSIGHDDKVHLYREVASLEYYIQQSCYKAILDTYDFKTHDRDIQLGLIPPGIDVRDPDGEVPKEIVKLFYKYRERMKKGSFHDEYGNELTIFKKVSYKQGLKNVKSLRLLFKTELNEILIRYQEE